MYVRLNFNCPQRFEHRLLHLCQPFHVRNIHSFIGPFTPERFVMFVRLQIPYDDTSVSMTAYQQFTMRTEGQRKNMAALVLQTRKALPTADFPETNRLIIASTGQQALIRAESNGSNLIGMAMERVQTVAGLSLPHANGLIPASTGEEWCLWVGSDS